MVRSPLLLLTCLASQASGADVAAALNTSDTAPWALSLSGNGFLAMAHGAGVVKALSNAGYLEKLTAVSSVSGGSWFNTLFAYSSSFHDGLVSKSTNIDDWFTSYQGECTARMSKLLPTECMKENGPNYCWADFVGAFLYPSDVTSLKATGQKRLQKSALGGAELLIASNIVTKSLMSDQSTTTLLDVNEIELPAYYTIAAAKTSHASTWNVPFVLGSFPMVEDGKGKQAAFQLPTDITVHQVGATSSAANGAAGAPGIKEGTKPASLFCKLFPCPSQKVTNVAESAICSDPSQGAHCAFPSVRYVDGCYSDNTGLAVNIGYLQKKHPGMQLNFYVVNSNQCDRSKDPNCIQSTHESTFRNLFSGSPYPSISSEGWINGGAGISVPTVDRVIFEESITDEQALGRAMGQGGVTVMSGTFTTIDNKAFGVSAGTKAKLVVFNANSAAPLQPQGPKDMAMLSALAKATFDVATSVVEVESAKLTSAMESLIV